MNAPPRPSTPLMHKALAPVRYAAQLVASAGKAASMAFRGSAIWAWSFLPRTSFDYGAEIGDGTNSNLLMASGMWLARTFPEAPVKVVEEHDDGTDETIRPHPMIQLMRHPNPHHTGVLMWMATVIDVLFNGNGYWWIIRDESSNEPRELWWLPSWMVKPKWPQDGSVYISHYEYTPNPTDPIKIDPGDIIHYRFGLDVNDTRQGYGILKMLAREVFTDEEASNMTAAIMKNAGVPGMVIIPDTKGASVDETDAKTLKTNWSAATTGDRRGDPFVLSSPAKVQQISMSMQELDMKAIRAIPESRVAAVTGIPAAVVGYLAGLEQTKVGATMRELREQAYENCIIPLQRILAEALDRQLLPEWDTTGRQRTVFDLTKVRVLQEDVLQEAKRWVALVDGAIAQRAEARAALGLEVDEADRVYHLGINILERPVGEVAPPPITLQERRNAERVARGGEAVGAGGGDGGKAQFKSHLGTGRDNRIDAGAAAISRVLAAQGRKAAELLEKTPGATAEELVPDDTKFVQTMRALIFAAFSFGADRAGALIGLEGQAMTQDGLLVANLPGLEAKLGPTDTAFVREITRLSGFIGNTSKATQKAVSEHLIVGRDRGYTVTQMISGVGKDGYAGLAVSFPFSPARAKRIAMDQITNAENIAAVTAWEESGVVDAVEILDGAGCGWTEHNDEDLAHGSIRSLEDAKNNPSAHPHCVRVVVPVVAGVARSAIPGSRGAPPALTERAT